MLKVGELARRSGVTVRTLHHYDSIGLLRPSGRSEGGYRLYNRADVARLHGIQVLRGIGLSLEQIADTLSRQGDGLALTVARQLSALERQIEQATRLRDRLRMVQAKYQEDGGEPELGDWLDTLQLMNACDAYFSPSEVRQIFGSFHLVEADLRRLAEEIGALMAAEAPPQDPRVQACAHRWVNLMYGWMQGDLDLMERWGKMYLAESTPLGGKRPSQAMIRYIGDAVALRVALLSRHLGPDEFRRLGPVPEADWAALSADALALAAQAPPPQAAPVRALLRRWHGLRLRVARGDTALDARLQQAYRLEPLLRDTAPLAAAAREYLWRMEDAQPGAQPTPADAPQEA